MGWDKTSAKHSAVGFVIVYENLESQSAVSYGISENMLEAAVDNEDLSSNITPGSTTAKVRDVLVLISPHCFAGQSPKEAWYGTARWHQTSSLFSSSWVKGDTQLCSCQVKPGESYGKRKRVEIFMGNNSRKQLANNLTNNGFLQCLSNGLFLGSLRNNQTQKLESKVFQTLLCHAEQN